MLAENLVSPPIKCKQLNVSSCQEHLQIQLEEGTQDDVNRSAEAKVGKWIDSLFAAHCPLICGLSPFASLIACKW